MAAEHREQRNAMLKLLFEQGRASQRSAALAGLIIVIGLWTVAPIGWLVTWYGFLLGTSLALLWLISKFFSVADDQEHLEYYARLYFVGIIISGLIWGSSAYLVFPLFPMPDMLVIIVVLVGITAGSALALPASHWYFLVFGFLAMTPLAVRFLEQGEQGYTIAAIAALLLIPALHLVSLDHYAFMKKMVDLANRNASLAFSLQQANIEMTVEMSRHQEYEKMVRDRDNALQLLNDLVLDVDSEFQRRLEHLLQFGCRLFHMDSGAIARINANRYEVWAAASATGPLPEKVGQVFDILETVCSHTVVAAGPVYFASAEEAGANIHPESRKNVGSYIGMALRADGRAWGTLSFYSEHQRKHEFVTADVDFMRLVAGWVQSSIELRKSKNESQNLEREMRIVFDAMPMHIAHINMEEQYTYVNRRYVEKFSRERQSIEGHHVREINGERNYELIKPYLQAALRGEYCSFEIKPFDRMTGEQGDRSVVIQYIPNRTPENKQDGCFALIIDVTPDEETRTMLASIAERDVLTGLATRTSFMEQLGQLLTDKRSQMQEHSICLIDLDNFAEVNERGGQLTGDDVLRRTADLVRARKRTSDLFARLGGDEFILLLPDCPINRSHGICRDFCRAVQEMKFVWGNQELMVTVSIGVISFPGTISDEDYLLQQAYVALEQAKKSGKNRVKSLQLEASESRNRTA
ncbi:MAG: diguanylate cyclase [Gammaproteobacteria bacterium]